MHRRIDCQAIRLSPVSLRSAVFASILIALCFGVVPIALADPPFTDDFNAYYGTNGGYNYQPVMGSCLTCHPSGSRRNAYANDWRSHSRSFGAVETLDSDGDGFDNLTEITAGTFPGDANSYPAIANQDPIANAGMDQTVDEGVQVTLNGSNSDDPDGTIVSYLWVQSGGSPVVTISNATSAQATFIAPDVGTSGTALTFDLTVTDDSGAEAVDTCIVNVSWVGQAPVANAGQDQIASEGDHVILDASAAHDPDGTIVGYQWVQIAGSPSVSLSDPTAMQPSFAAPNVGVNGASLTFQLTVTDNEGLQSNDTCIVTIAWVNLPPVANTGGNRTVSEGTIVTLNGLGSNDPDDGIAVYVWRQTAGMPVSITNSTTAVASFTAPVVDPQGTMLQFELTVTDNGGLQATDVCDVFVQNVNVPPAAVVGPSQTVNPGDLVVLDGTNSNDPDGTIAAYAWLQTGSGPAVSLSASNAATASFIAPDVGSTATVLTFELTVTDDLGAQASASTVINVAAGMMPPVAAAGGDQTVDEAMLVQLDGTNSSDPDGTIASYAWQQTGGPAVTLSTPQAAQSTFYAPDVGVAGAALQFRLTVTDNDGLIATDTCIINVSWINGPPVSNAGMDQSVEEGAAVILDGSNASDPDDGIATYAWRQVAGPVVTLTAGNAPTTGFTAPDVGPEGVTLTFELTVTDHAGLQASDTCLVSITWINVPPVAHAGGTLYVDEGVSVALDGSASNDTDDGIGGYLWTQLSGPAVTLSDPTSISPTFFSPNVGNGGAALTFQLTVTDNGGLQATDTAIVNVSWVNLPPVAHAGHDQQVDEGGTVTLDGSGSHDLDDGVATYLWRQTGGVPVTFSDPGIAQPTFVTPPVDVAGDTLTFELTVTDNTGMQDADVVMVDIVDNGIALFPNDVLPMVASTGDPIGIKEEGGGNCTSLCEVDPYTLPDAVDRPDNLIYGLIDINLNVVPGATAQIAVYLPAPAPPEYRWYKYNRITRQWIDYTNTWIDGAPGAVFNAQRDRLTLTLKDGGVGDDDGLANGIILDPSGLGTPAVLSSGGTALGNIWGSPSGCFIATAAYGSFMSPHVKLLRQFRDRFLIPTTIGRKIVGLYYRLSPPVAEAISRNDQMRTIVRWSLIPLVAMSWALIHLGAWPVLGALLGLGIIALTQWARGSVLLQNDRRLQRN